MNRLLSTAGRGVSGAGSRGATRIPSGYRRCDAGSAVAA
jgi:hypothetical protein